LDKISDSPFSVRESGYSQIFSIFSNLVILLPFRHFVLCVN
jgi:hypothetical protein